MIFAESNGMKYSDRILVYGYGNPGRQDDGLAAELIRRVDDWKHKHFMASFISTDCNYQLNIEDAAAVAPYDMVIFADASDEEIDDYKLTPITPESDISFTMHAVNPAYVVNLCREIYGYDPEAYLLHIKGYQWEMKEELTEKAVSNLDRAFHFLISFLQEKRGITKCCPEEKQKQSL